MNVTLIQQQISRKKVNSEQQEIKYFLALKGWGFVMEKTWILFELTQLVYAFSQQTLVTSWRTVLFLRGTHVLSEAALFELTLDNCFWFCCDLSFKGGSFPDEQWAAARALVTRPDSSPVFSVTLLSFFISAKIHSSTKNYNLGVSILQQKDRIIRKQNISKNTRLLVSIVSHQTKHFELDQQLHTKKTNFASNFQALSSEFSNFMVDQVHFVNAEWVIKLVYCWLLEIKHTIGTTWVSSKLFEWHSKFNLVKENLA